MTKMKYNTEITNYESPECFVQEVLTEGVLCGSGASNEDLDEGINYIW